MPTQINYLTLILVLAALLLVLLTLRFFNWFKADSIRVRIISMREPEILNDGDVLRKPVRDNSSGQKLIDGERWLRERAYRHVPVIKGESFFDDSDMCGPYFLIIVYCRKSGIPMLSARYYFNQPAVANCFPLENYAAADNTSAVPGNVFLIDRLSGNISSRFYRENRSLIRTAFIAALYRQTKNQTILAMARCSERDGLRIQYEQLGLSVSGSRMHQGKAHWLMQANMRECFLKLTKADRFKFRLHQYGVGLFHVQFPG